MNRQQLVSLSLKLFPENLGIILTGSQAFKEIFSKDLDIDVIIFDKYSSDVHSHGFDEKGFRIDYTVIPIFDIENVLLNEKEHEKGILFTMLAKGVLLVGNFDLFNWIQSKVKEDLQNEIESNRIGKASAYYELSRAQKYLKRELSTFDKLIIFSEIIFHIGTIELLEIEKRDSRYLKRSSTIIANNHRLAKEIEVIFESAYQKNNTKVAIEFINKYLKDKTQSVATKNGDILFVEIKSTSYSFSEYVKQLEPKILSDDLLKSAFQFSFISLKKYFRIFKGTVTICFRTEKFTDSELIVALTNIIGVAEITISTTPMKPIFSITNYKILWRIYHSFYGVYDIQNIAVGFILDVQKLLEYEINDVVDLNKILLQKWVLTKEEQQQIRIHLDLYKILRKKINDYDSFYYNNKESINCHFSQDSFLTSQHQELAALQNTFIGNLKKEVKENNFRQNLKDYPLCLLEEMGIPPIDKSVAYIQVIEEIFKMLNLSDNEKAKTIYISSLLLLDF